jgi:hypothetical protein
MRGENVNLQGVAGVWQGGWPEYRYMVNSGYKYHPPQSASTVKWLKHRGLCRPGYPPAKS